MGPRAATAPSVDGGRTLARPMTEQSPIERTAAAGRLPATRPSLVRDLRELGVEAGDVLIVHSSLSALGYVVGGAQTVVEALLDAVGPRGTLAMPAFSGDRGDPEPWCNPPVPREWWALLREHMPAFDPRFTPGRRMGAVADCFRAWPGVRRSGHPSCSVAALGPLAAEITDAHDLAPAFGESSPLARIYDRGGRVLLLGVTHANDSSLHLAESRAGHGRVPTTRGGAPILVDGERRWVTYEDFDYDSDDFERLGEDFARESGRERHGPAGLGTARLCEQREIVDHGVRWIASHRPPLPAAG